MNVSVRHGDGRIQQSEIVHRKPAARIYAVGEGSGTILNGNIAIARVDSWVQVGVELNRQTVCNASCRSGATDNAVISESDSAALIAQGGGSRRRILNQECDTVCGAILCIPSGQLKGKRRGESAGDRLLSVKPPRARCVG